MEGPTGVMYVSKFRSLIYVHIDGFVSKPYSSFFHEIDFFAVLDRYDYSV